MKLLPELEADRVYDLLVEHAGASDDRMTRMQFENFFHRFEAREFRFCGELGFGGKFWITPVVNPEGDCPWYVTCYREDMNEERQVIIDNTNAALQELWIKEKGSP